MPQAICSAVIIYKMKGEFMVITNKVAIKVTLEFISRVVVKAFFNGWDGAGCHKGNYRDSGRD